MPLNEEFLNNILNNEEIELADKVKSILSEYEADNRGLVQKRDELLGKTKKYQEQIQAYETGKADYETRITSLEDELKKNSPEQHKQFYDSQLASKTKEFDEKLSKLSAERDFYKSSHLKRLQDDAVAEGTKDIQFIDGLKKRIYCNRSYAE